jgi:hypothetical protein
VVKGHTTTESLASNRSSWTMTQDTAYQHRQHRRRRSRSRHASSGVPGRDRVDELLVLSSVGTPGNSHRLTVSCAGEGLRPHVWNPNLNGTKPLLAQTVAMGADLVAGCRSSTSRHAVSLRKVTCNEHNLTHRGTAARVRGPAMALRSGTLRTVSRAAVKIDQDRTFRCVENLAIFRVH